MKFLKAIKYIIKLTAKIILLIWQLPQHLLALGLVLLCIFCRIKLRWDGEIIIMEKFWAGGVCLGEFIFVPKNGDGKHTRDHEMGHRCQSRMLGPLYLIIVGIPSACLCLAAKHSCRISHTYFEHFPENWANSLGHVDREHND